MAKKTFTRTDHYLCVHTNLKAGKGSKECNEEYVQRCEENKPYFWELSGYTQWIADDIYDRCIYNACLSVPQEFAAGNY